MNQGTFTSFLTYSGEKIFPDSSISESIKEGSCFANEPYMLTLAYSSDEPQVCPPITMSAVCPGTEVSVYKVGYVPVTRTDLDYDEAASEKNGPGLFPDILFKRSAEPHIVKRNDSRLPFYEKDEDNLITATKFEIFENYLKNATLNGMNMLLTPFFTPPLDTFIGGERTCVQLVDIEKTGTTINLTFPLRSVLYDLLFPAV